MIAFIIAIIFLAALLVVATICHVAIDGINRRHHPKPGYDVASIPDQSGKVIVITGGTTGIGRATAEQLCKKGAKLIIITSRSQASADKAAQQIQQQFASDPNQTQVIGQELTLEDYKSIEKFATWFRSLNEPLHVLMLNAGFAGLDKSTTSLGMEKTVGVNWFGNFYLQQLLQDIVELSAPSRIVVTASRAAMMTPPLTQSIESYVTGRESYGPHQYNISKLFNIYHTRELHRRLRDKGINNVYVNTLHPGLVRTNVFDNMLGMQRFPLNYIQAIKKIIEKEIGGGFVLLFIAIFAEFLGLTPLEGALTLLYVATSPDIESNNISGEYIYPIARREDPSPENLQILSYQTPQMRDDALARKVWEYGESVIANLPNDE